MPSRTRFFRSIAAASIPRAPQGSALSILATMALVISQASCASSVSPPEFSSERVVSDVVSICSRGPRLPGSAARDSTAAFIARRVQAHGATVTMQAFDQPDPWGAGSFRLINIIASFAPDRTKRVMIASHYDSRPWADNEADSSLHGLPVPGAVDGAASTAILLEMARLFAIQAPADVGVDLVFFDGEDYGRPTDLSGYCLGSKYFAANLKGYRPTCALLLDMVGGVGTRVARETNSVRANAALVDTVFARAGHLGLGSFINVNAPEIYDDHLPLLQAGIKAIDIFGYDYSHWHTLQDTPDKVDPDLVAEVGALLVNFIYLFPF